MKTRPMLLVRANATASLGTGHFMRGLALAQAWSDRGGAVSFACNADVPPWTAERARDEGFDVFAVAAAPGAEDGRATRDLARRLGARFVASDGYSFGVEFQSAVREAAPLLVIDDNAENETYVADFVLNQNLNAVSDLYRDRATTTRLLLGPRYALLRREFTAAAAAAAARNDRPADQILRVVVTMGGTDPRRLTGIIVEAVRLAFDGAEVIAVLGKAVEAGPLNATVLRDVRDMAHVLASADLAVCAAGSTAWELAAVGTPMVLVVCADNQRAHARALIERGAALLAGEWDLTDVGQIAARVSQAATPQVRGRLLGAARSVIDGQGAARVADTLWAVNTDL